MDRSPLASFCPSFRSAPAPGQLFLTDAHRHAMTMIRAGIGGDRPVQLLTGEAGTGKTILAQQIALDCAADMQVGRIGQTHAQLMDLPRHVPRALGIATEPPTGGPGSDFVVSACRDLGRPVLLIVDEAQALSDEGLDYLAGLVEGSAPISLLLVGGCELEGRLASRRQEGLGSRIAGRFRLAPLDEAETAAYVAHRFEVSGCDCHRGIQVFDAAAAGQLHRLSRGVPRVINHLVQGCLFEAASTGHKTMDDAFVRDCLAGLVGDGRLAHLVSAAPRKTPAAPAAAAAATLKPALASSLPAPPRHSRPAPSPQEKPAARRLPLRSRTIAVAVAAVGLLSLVPGSNPTAPPGGALSAAGLLPLVAAPRAVVQEAAPEPGPAAVRRTPPLSQRVAIRDVPDPESLLSEALTIGSANPQRAARLYTRAALWGSKRAAYYLGQLYETGIGVEPDLHRARAWYQAAEGIDGAASRLADLQALPPQPVTEAAAPIPAGQELFRGGQTELQWRDPQGLSVPRFRVEFVAAGHDKVQRLDTARSALLVTTPVTRWRVIALDAEGAEGSASDWSRLRPGPR